MLYRYDQRNFMQPFVPVVVVQSYVMAESFSRAAYRSTSPSYLGLAVVERYDNILNLVGAGTIR